MGWGRGHARLAPLVVDVVAVAAVLDADAAPLVVLAVEGVLVVAVAALLVADVQRAVAGVVAARHHLFRQQRTRSSVAAALLTRETGDRLPPLSLQETSEATGCGPVKNEGGATEQLRSTAVCFP